HGLEIDLGRSGGEGAGGAQWREQGRRRDRDRGATSRQGWHGRPPREGKGTGWTDSMDLPGRAIADCPMSRGAGGAAGAGRRQRTAGECEPAAADRDGSAAGRPAARARRRRETSPARTAAAIRVSIVQARGTVPSPNIFSDDATRTRTRKRRISAPGAREEIREPR